MKKQKAAERQNVSDLFTCKLSAKKAAAILETGRRLELPDKETLRCFRAWWDGITTDYAERAQELLLDDATYPDGADAQRAAERMFQENPERRSVTLYVGSPTSVEVEILNRNVIKPWQLHCAPPQAPKPAVEAFTLELPAAVVRRLRYFAKDEGQSPEQYMAVAVTDRVHNDHVDPAGHPIDTEKETAESLKANAPRKGGK
jgi:hypothetical protein